MQEDFERLTQEDLQPVNKSLLNSVISKSKQFVQRLSSSKLRKSQSQKQEEEIKQSIQNSQYIPMILPTQTILYEQQQPKTIPIYDIIPAELLHAYQYSVQQQKSQISSIDKKIEFLYKQIEEQKQQKEEIINKANELRDQYIKLVERQPLPTVEIVDRSQIKQEEIDQKKQSMISVDQQQEKKEEKQEIKQEVKEEIKQQEKPSFNIFSQQQPKKEEIQIKQEEPPKQEESKQNSTMPAFSFNFSNQQEKPKEQIQLNLSQVQKTPEQKPQAAPFQFNFSQQSSQPSKKEEQPPQPQQPEQPQQQKQFSFNFGGLSQQNGNTQPFSFNFNNNNLKPSQ